VRKAFVTHPSYPKWWVLPNSKFYEVWSYFLMIIAQTWILIFIPYRLSYEDRRIVTLTSVLCDTSADLFFFIDSIITLCFIPI